MPLCKTCFDCIFIPLHLTKWAVAHESLCSIIKIVNFSAQYSVFLILFEKLTRLSQFYFFQFLDYFKKKDEHRLTYKSRGKCTQVDYVMYRRRNLKEMWDCKVILNECVAKQHRMVVCKMVLMVKKKKAEKVNPKIR